MTTFQYLQSLKYEGQKREAQEAEDRRRTQSMEDKQMALLDAEIANMQSDSGGPNEGVRQQAQSAATEYLGKWNKALSSAEGMYSSAISEVGKAGELIDKAYGEMGRLDEVAGDIEKEWSTFKSDFQGTQQDLLSGAQEGIEQRGELRRSFMDLTKADYEGAAGRAQADVSGMAERGRQAEAMKLQGMGIDPTSGRSRSLMRSSRNQEALAGAMAGNKARMDEKSRVAGLTAQGMQLIDPTKDISAASQIQQMSSNLLAQRANMATTKAGFQTDLAKSRGALATTTANIAGGQAKNIAGQYGDYGAGQQGIAYANAPTGGASSRGPMTVSGYAGSIGVTGFESQDRELSGNLRTHLDTVKRGQALKAKLYG